MSSDFNKVNAVNAMILIEKDNYYYYVSNIPKLLKEIDDEASKKLISYIMQRFLDCKLLKDLKFCKDDQLITLGPDFFDFLVNSYNFSKNWEYIKNKVNNDINKKEFYEPYVNEKYLMVHVEDIIKVFKDFGLEQEAKDLEDKVLKPAKNKILIQEADQQIIELYNEIKKQNPGYSDEKCAKEIKKNVIKGKNDKTIKKDIAEKIMEYKPRTITDKISDYFSKLIKNLYNEYKTRWNNFLIPEVKYGIAYKELENNKKTLNNLEKESLIIKEQMDKLKIEIENADKEHYNTHQEKIDCLYKGYGTKPTDAEIIKVLNEEFITYTAKDICRPEHSIRCIIFQKQKK